MATPFTISHPLGRVPTFDELQKLAPEFEVQVTGNEQSGVISHPKANGTYRFEKNGALRGDFTAGVPVLGKINGYLVLLPGNAEVTITKKPLLVPEEELRKRVSEGLNGFCAKFPPKSE